MSVTETISNRIRRMRKGQPFAGSLFLNAGSRASVDKALSRMVQAGTLERVIRGVYMRPKESRILGRVRPSPSRVVEAITKAKQEVIQIHGAEAVRRLGLSTQMQVQTVYYTSGSTREIRVGSAVIRLRHVSNDRLQAAGTPVGVALTALHYLGREEASEAATARILLSLSREEISKLRACRMPEWMRSVVSQAVKDVECKSPTSIYPQKNSAIS